MIIANVMAAALNALLENFIDDPPTHPRNLSFRIKLF